MTEQQVREIFDRHAVEHRGFMFFPCKLIQAEFGEDVAVFTETEFRMDCSEWSTHRIGLPGLLQIVNRFEFEQEQKRERTRRNEIDDIIRIMYEPNSRPNWALPYEPEADLEEAERESDAALQAIGSKITPEEWSVLEDAISAYGAASEIAAFDRGFRQGAQMVLQLIQSNAQPIPAI